jgi:hypothetical protein
MVRMKRPPSWKRQIAGAVCLCCLLAGVLEAQPRGNRLLPRYVTVGPPDQAEGRRVLEEFRQLGLPGDYYLEFVLEILPRRGERTRVPGRLWGTRGNPGPLTRLELDPAGMPAERLLVEGGIDARAWHWTRSPGATPRPSTSRCPSCTGRSMCSKG